MERAAECLRSRIAKRHNFLLKEAFSYADVNKDGYVSSEDIRNMLAEHGFFATERELVSIMKKFDRDGDSKINYSEFIEEMTPKIINSR